MELGVRLTTVPSLGEADVICGLLRVEGIDADFADYIFSEGSQGVGYEILVRQSDLERAHEVIGTAAEEPHG